MGFIDTLAIVYFFPINNTLKCKQILFELGSYWEYKNKNVVQVWGSKMKNCALLGIIMCIRRDLKPTFLYFHPAISSIIFTISMIEVSILFVTMNITCLGFVYIP